MKVTIELPDTTVCAFVNYVYSENSGLLMGAKSIDSDYLEKAKVSDTE